MSEHLYHELDDYITGLFPGEDAILQAVTQCTIDAGMPRISVSPAQGRLLYLLAKLGGAKRILELGTLAGYSTINLARAISSGGQVISLESNPYYAEVARNNIHLAGLDEMVTLRIGVAKELLLLLPGEKPFDLVFIDADKPSYPEYLQLTIPLCRSGALILADNIIRSGQVLNQTSDSAEVIAIRQFNEDLAKDDRLDATLLSTVGVKGLDGIALAVVK